MDYATYSDAKIAEEIAKYQNLWAGFITASGIWEDLDHFVPLSPSKNHRSPFVHNM